MGRRLVSMSGGANSTGGDIEVGDSVDVPGDMYGVIKFIGKIKGKGPGVFAGVELASEFAGRGKNDGDVDGCVFPLVCDRWYGRDVLLTT
jgi:dynactin complex subunit